MPLDVVNDAKAFLLPGWLAGRVPPHALTGTFILKGTFDLKPGAAMAPAGEPLPLNDEVFEGDDEKQSLRYPGDAALFKPKADLLLVGDCVPPGGRLAPVVQVEFSVGAWKKAVAVIGNRRWAGGIAPHPSEPEPFRAVPLRWENAYGGPGYKWNPIGKGAEGVVLPNLEIPGRLITSKSAPPGPAGLGPIPRTWPQRTRSAGTCDGKWLKEDWPWLPRDFDWSTLNAAPADQQAPFLRGDEAVRIAGMHPGFPVLETRLPGIRPRWFVMQKKPKGEEFTELHLHLDTLWVDMKALQAVLVWRAVHPVSDRKLRDVLGHRIAAEPLAGKPAPPEEHRKAFDAGRTAAAQGPPETKPAAPGGPAEDEKALAKAAAERAALEKKALSQATRVRKFLVDRGKAHGRVLDILGEADPSRTRLLAPVLAYFEGLKAALPELAEKVGPPPMPGEPLLPELLKPGPPWTRRQVEAWAAKGFDFSGQDLAGLDLSGLDLSKGKFEKAILADANLRGAKLAGASLKCAVLARADLRGADLEGADLTASDAGGADLSEARLGKASLAKADLAGCRLKKADLAGAKAEAAVFARSDLREAAAAKAAFKGADFSGCLLERADFSGADLAEASLTKASGPGLNAKEAKIDGLRAAGANLAKACFRACEGKAPIFEEGVLDEADFFGAKIPQANFIQASAKKALFSMADLKEARFDEADLREVKALKANLFHAGLEGAKLGGADFSASNLFEANSWLSSAAGARFDLANVKGTKLG